MKRIRAVSILMSICCMLITYSFIGLKAEAAPTPLNNISKEEWDVLKLVNKERMKRNNTPLSMFSKLQNATDIRVKELVKYFSHYRPNGEIAFTVLDETKVKNYNYAGENIASGQVSAERVMTGWMNSPGHKKNILNSNYTHIGVGHYYTSSSIYRNFWAQMFVGKCNATEISIVDGDRTYTYSRGTSIETMDRVVKISCVHGTSYMPLSSEMCKGYDKNSTGKQTIKVTYGSKTAKFTVKIPGGTSIKSAVVSNVKNKTYNGKNQSQSVKVVLNGKTLTKNSDYTITYKNHKNAGTATLTVRGKGDYHGTINKTFSIKKCHIKAATINKIKNQKYTGKSIKPNVTLKYGGAKVNKKFYTVSYKNNKKAGTATITITGKINFTGSVKKTFKIVK